MSDRDQEFLEALALFEAGDRRGGPGAMAMASPGEDASYADDLDDDLEDDLDVGDLDDDLEDDEDDTEVLTALQQYGLEPAAAAAAMGAATGAMAGAQATAANAAVRRLCDLWGSVRPIVRRIRSFLRRVPVIGTSLLQAVNTLIALLDGICRGGSVAALCRRWRSGLRTIMVRIAGIVRRIPFIGRRAARAINRLIAAIDAVCGLATA